MYRIQIRECSPVLGYVLQRGAINCQKLSRHTRPTKMCSVTSVVTRSGASNTAHYAKLKFRKKVQKIYSASGVVTCTDLQVVSPWLQSDCYCNEGIRRRSSAVCFRQVRLRETKCTANESMVRPDRRRAAARSVPL